MSDHANLLGRVVAGKFRVETTIQLSIDERGGITAIVEAPPKLTQFARCAQQTVGGQRVDAAALDAPSAGAVASQWLTLHP